MLDTCFYVSGTVFHILLLSWISMAFSEDSFRISKDKYPWLGAGEECMPATPYITAASNTPTVYSVGDLGIHVPENEETWVGYYQVERVFEYIGCVSQGEYFSIQPGHGEIKGDPGHCFPRCTGSTIVGVTKTRCYCLGDIWNANVTTTFPECTHQCDHPAVACGFDTTNFIHSYLSIYKINTNVDHSTINDWQGFKVEKNCLCIDGSKHLKKYYWQYCTAALLVMCNDGDDIYIEKGKPNADYKTWMGAADFCFLHNYFPTNKSSSIKVKREGAPLWTGCFKTLVTFKHDTNVSEERRHDKKRYGYLYKDKSNQLKLGFSTNSTSKRVLCGKGNSVKTKKMTTKETRSTSTESSQLNTSDKGTNGVYVAIGASAAGLVLLIIIGVMIFFIKRRRKEKNSKSKGAKGPKHGNENDDTFPDLTVRDTAQAINNYSIPKARETEGENENVTYDTTDENATYDTTEDGQEYERVKTENVYNHLDVGTEQTYDLTVTQKTNKSGEANKMSLDDTYDSASADNQAKGYMHIDNIYDKTEDIDDNVYNQLGEKCVQNVTENVYGIQEHNV